MEKLQCSASLQICCVLDSQGIPYYCVSVCKSAKMQVSNNQKQSVVRVTTRASITIRITIRISRTNNYTSAMLVYSVTMKV